MSPWGHLSYLVPLSDEPSCILVFIFHSCILLLQLNKHPCNWWCPINIPSLDRPDCHFSVYWAWEGGSVFVSGVNCCILLRTIRSTNYTALPANSHGPVSLRFFRAGETLRCPKVSGWAGLLRQGPHVPSVCFLLGVRLLPNLAILLGKTQIRSPHCACLVI